MDLTQHFGNSRHTQAAIKSLGATHTPQTNTDKVLLNNLSQSQLSSVENSLEEPRSFKVDFGQQALKLHTFLEKAKVPNADGDMQLSISNRKKKPNPRILVQLQTSSDLETSTVSNMRQMQKNLNNIQEQITQHTYNIPQRNGHALLDLSQCGIFRTPLTKDQSKKKSPSKLKPLSVPEVLFNMPQAIPDKFKTIKDKWSYGSRRNASLAATLNRDPHQSPLENLAIMDLPIRESNLSIQYSDRSHLAPSVLEDPKYLVGCRSTQNRSFANSTFGRTRNNSMLPPLNDKKQSLASVVEINEHQNFSQITMTRKIKNQSQVGTEVQCPGSQKMNEYKDESIKEEEDVLERKSQKSGNQRLTVKQKKNKKKKQKMAQINQIVDERLEEELSPVKGKEAPVHSKKQRYDKSQKKTFEATDEYIPSVNLPSVLRRKDTQKEKKPDKPTDTVDKFTPPAAYKLPWTDDVRQAKQKLTIETKIIKDVLQAKLKEEAVGILKKNKTSPVFLNSDLPRSIFTPTPQVIEDVLEEQESGSNNSHEPMTITNNKTEDKSPCEAEKAINLQVLIGDDESKHQLLTPSFSLKPTPVDHKIDTPKISARSGSISPLSPSLQSLLPRKKTVRILSSTDSLPVKPVLITEGLHLHTETRLKHSSSILKSPARTPGASPRRFGCSSEKSRRMSKGQSPPRSPSKSKQDFEEKFGQSPRWIWVGNKEVPRHILTTMTAEEKASHFEIIKHERLDEQWEKVISLGDKFVERQWSEYNKSDPGHSVKSLFSNHPSVQEEMAFKAEAERKKHILKKTLVKVFQPTNLAMSRSNTGFSIHSPKIESEEDESHEDDEEESLGSDSAGERKKKAQEDEAQNQAKNLKKEQMKNEIILRKKEEENNIELCGKNFMEHMAATLTKFATASKDITKGTNILIPRPDVEKPEEDDPESMEVLTTITKKEKEKHAAHMEQMLQSGNTSVFNQEMNKNYFSNKKSKAAQKYTRLGMAQAAFYQACKKYVDLEQTEEGRADPRIKFFEECIKNKALCMPILNKIVDYSLTLKNFKLSEGSCRAIAGFLDLNQHGLRRLCLEHNGMAGDHLNAILDGLFKQTFFKQLIIHDNELNEESIEYLEALLKKRHPENLETLRLSHCKINWQYTNKLVNSVQKNGRFLKKLELVKVNLNEFGVKSLIEAIRTNKSITHLDISWNGIVPDKMQALLQVMMKNRRIQYLNLSWNSIVDQFDAKSINQQQTILLMLGRLIKFNKKFLHFDLTSTGLTKYIIHALGHQLKRSRSLLALHLSGNPGLSDENTRYLHKRIVCRPNEDIDRFTRIQSTVKQSFKGQKAEIVDGVFAKQLKIVEPQTEFFEPPDRFILQRMIGNRNIAPGSGQWYEASNTSVPNSQHPKHKCWLCEGHVFSVIFWCRKFAFRLKPIFSSESGEGGEVEKIRAQIDILPAGMFEWQEEEEVKVKVVEVKEDIEGEEETVCEVKKEIKNQDGTEIEEEVKNERQLREEKEKAEEIKRTGYDPGLGFANGTLPYDELDDRRPYIAGSFTGWRYQKMRSVFEICSEFDKDYQEPFERCKGLGIIGRRTPSLKECTKSEKKGYYHMLLKHTLEYTYEPGWIRSFKNSLRYKKPFIVNGYEMNDWFKEDTEIRRREQGMLDDAEDDMYDLQDMPQLSSDEEEDRIKKKAKREVRKDKKAIRREKMAKRRERRENGETEVSQSESDINSEENEFNAETIDDAMMMYALPLFIKPGKQQYMIKYKDSTQRAQARALLHREKNKKLGKDRYDPAQIAKDLQPELFLYECPVSRRDEEIPEFAKAQLVNIVERKYKTDKSVFRFWRSDNPNNYEKMAEQDFQYWKVGQKMIKDEEDRDKVHRIIAKNYGKIKHIFIYLASKSSYPAITQLDYSHFVQKCGILDKNVNLAAVDRAFIATNVRARDMPEVPNNPGNALCRFEFLEILVRLATEKYRGPGITNTFSDALEKLLYDCVFKNYTPEPWQDFREQQLWTLDVTDIFEANIENIREIYAKYFTQIKKWMELEDCIQMINKDCDLKMHEKEIQLCFGMSKMTVPNEVYDAWNYTKLKQVEMLEFLGRIANIKYKNNPEMNLATKLEYLLDDIFATFNMYRQEPEVELEEVSESDLDY